MDKNYWLLIVIIFVIAIYFAMKKIGAKYPLPISNLMRGIIFFLIMAFLCYDFITKEKYFLLVPVAMGSAAFFYYLLKFGKKKDSDDSES